MSTIPKKKLKKSDLMKGSGMRQPEIESFIDDVQTCQVQLNEISGKEEVEKSELEELYTNLKQLVYERRDSIIHNIPEFWMKCFENHPALQCLLGRDSSECLKYMTKFRVEDGDKSGNSFKISFFFEENPFFENQVLSKYFTLGVDGDYSSSSTSIAWKPRVGVRKIATGRKRALEEDGFTEWFLNNRNPCATLPGLLYCLWLKPIPYFLGQKELDDGLSLLLCGENIDESDEED